MPLASLIIKTAKAVNSKTSNPAFCPTPVADGDGIFGGGRLRGGKEKSAARLIRLGLFYPEGSCIGIIR